MSWQHAQISKSPIIRFTVMGFSQHRMYVSTESAVIWNCPVGTICIRVMVGGRGFLTLAVKISFPLLLILYRGSRNHNPMCYGKLPRRPIHMKPIKLQTDDVDIVAETIAGLKGKTMALIRGLPGHNRNSFARELADEFEDSQCFGFDDLFTVDPAAVERLYVFQPGRVEESHEIVRRKTQAAMHRGAPVIIVANPFLHRENIVKFFLPEAAERGYNVIVVTLSEETDPEVLSREDEHGTHGAPPDAIARMLEQWEQDPDLSRTPVA